MRSLDLLKPDSAAAIIIDLQRGYCDPNSDCAIRLKWDVTTADKVCHAHAPYLESLRKILPPNRIVWSQMEEAADTYASNNAYGATGDLASEFVPLCVRGTPGHDFHIVKPAEGEKVIFKVQHSIFSCHTPDAAGLAEYLKSLGVSQLVFSGVVASRCVNASVIVASNYLGFECVLLSDLVTGPKHLEVEITEHLKTTNFFYANTRTAEEVLKQLTRSR